MRHVPVFLDCTKTDVLLSHRLSLTYTILHLQLHGQGTMKVDESSLTGESLAATKKTGATVLAGAVVAEGEMDAVVSAIGKECFFGKTMALLDAPQEVGHLHQVCDFSHATFLVPSIQQAVLCSYAC